MGAAAASKGAVGLFHVVGVTPEAPTRDAAFQGDEPGRRIVVTTDMVRSARDSLSSTRDTKIDCVALGSPHFSPREFQSLLPLLKGRRLVVPFYVCTSRATIDSLRQLNILPELESLGVTFVVDTCVVVTPILSGQGGTLMTNSGKFAHYAIGTIGYDAVFGTLSDCVASAEAGQVTRDETVWQ